MKRAGNRRLWEERRLKRELERLSPVFQVSQGGWGTS